MRRSGILVSLLLLAVPMLRGGSQEALSAARAQARRLPPRLSDNGFSRAAQLCLDAYAALEPPPSDLERVRAEVERDRERAPRREKLEEAIRDTERLAEACMTAARAAEGPEAERIARIALRFDSRSQAANERLKNVPLAGGRWATPEEAARLARRGEIARALAEARTLGVDVQVRKASDPALLEVLGSAATAVEHDGLVFESYLPIDTLIATVEAIVRAMAFSSWLLEGEMIPRHEGGKILHLPKERHAEFLERIVAAQRADPRGPAPDPRRAFSYVTMPREGEDVYRSYAVATGCLQSALGPFTLVLYDRSLSGWDWDTWYKPDPVVPFWLVVGHLNLVSLVFLGASPPDFEINVDERETVSKVVRPTFVLGEAGIVGCRSWLRDLAREGADPPLASCVLDQFSKITGERRLKAISVVEQLHESASLARFLDAYVGLRDGELAGEEATRGPVERAEKVLGCTLPALDARWRAWILGAEAASVRDALEALRSAEPADPAAAEVLQRLNERRASAGLDPVALDAELSHGAAEHAAYLARHRDQAARWPDAHEQRPDAEGFTPAGSWAGAHSIIAYDGPARCIDDWLATFYHRLPLLHPGLLRVGFGRAGDVCVLDAGSVVSPEGTWEVAWPVGGQKGVPRAFPGELPPPVPDRAEPGALGYPITFQLGPRVDARNLSISLLDEAGKTVPCVTSTPSAPSNPLMAPDQAWCLIPAAPLASSKEYRVRVEFGGVVREWSFETRR